MTTDNKTLADVQPGGRVRLGDQAELDRLEFQAWARWFVAPVERDEAGDYVSGFTRGLWCAWQAALAAQPSPGGQGDLRSRFTAWVKANGYNPATFASGRYMGDGVQVAWEAMQALAARQPVDEVSVKKEDANNYCLILRALGMEEEGDPVAEVQALIEARDRQPVGVPVAVVTTSDRFTYGKLNRDLPDGTHLYAAPTAQAVDLGPVRDVFRRWHANELNSTDAMLALVEALAVIDSQAVGNG
ncbi:TPA: hypothetical protein ACOEQU_000121 [Stenotrophomonas maltophilia]